MANPNRDAHGSGEPTQREPRRPSRDEPSIRELLAQPGADDFEFDPPRMGSGIFRPAAFGDTENPASATRTPMLHVHMDPKLKEDAVAVLDAFGLTAADAVRMLFQRIVAEQTFPLQPNVPDAAIRAATAEADQVRSSPKDLDSAAGSPGPGS